MSKTGLNKPTTFEEQFGSDRGKWPVPDHGYLSHYLVEAQKNQPASFLMRYKDLDSKAVTMLDNIIKVCPKENKGEVVEALFSKIGVRGFLGGTIFEDDVAKAFGLGTHQVDAGYSSAEIGGNSDAVTKTEWLVPTKQDVQRFTTQLQAERVTQPAAEKAAVTEKKVGFWRGLLNKAKAVVLGSKTEVETAVPKTVLAAAPAAAPKAVKVVSDEELDKKIDRSIDNARKDFVRTIEASDGTMVADARGTPNEVRISSAIRDKFKEDLRTSTNPDAASENHANIIRVMLARKSSVNPELYQRQAATGEMAKPNPDINEKFTPSVIMFGPQGVDLDENDLCNYKGEKIALDTALESPTSLAIQVAEGKNAMNTKLSSDHMDRQTNADVRNASLEADIKAAGENGITPEGHTDAGHLKRQISELNAEAQQNPATQEEADAILGTLKVGVETGKLPFPPKSTPSRGNVQGHGQGSGRGE